MTTTGGLVRGFALGMSTGGRSFTGSAVLAATSSRPGVRARTTLGVLAAAELVADKLPGVPSRTAPPGLVPRITLGAVDASILARRYDQRLAPMTAAGVAGALAGTYGGAFWRGHAGELGLPAWVAAVIEDLVVGALAVSACHS